MPQTFADLFSPEPSTWGLRGDPYLWRELAALLADTALPNSRSAARQTIEHTIVELTGADLYETDPVLIDRYPADGQSGQHISMPYWTSTAIPLLISRFRGQAPRTRDYFTSYLASVEVL